MAESRAVANRRRSGLWVEVEEEVATVVVVVVVTEVKMVSR